MAKLNDVFPKSDVLVKRVKKMQAPKKKSYKPLPPGTVDNSIKTDQDPLDSLQKDDLIDILLDENKEIDWKKFLSAGVNDTGKTISSLKGIRETLEDMVNIHELKDLVHFFRAKKGNGKEGGQEQTPEEQAQQQAQMMQMLPLLQQMKQQQQGNQQTGGQIDMEQMLLMSMMNQGGNNGGNNMLPIVMMMMMNQQQQPQQQQINGVPQTNNNTEFMQQLYSEVKNIMGNQQQQQKPSIDPATMMMYKMISDKNNQSHGTIDVLLTKFDQMMQNNQSQQMSQILQQMENNSRIREQEMKLFMENMAGVLQGDPMGRLMKNFEIFQSMQSQQQGMTEAQMNFKLAEKQMDLEKQRYDESLDREERSLIRSDVKGQNMMKMAQDIITPIVQNGIGGIVNDVMSASRQMGRRKQQAPMEASDIDLL